MTDVLLSTTDREEALSRAYVQTIAAGAGYVVGDMDFDRDGVDITVKAGGGMRPCLDIQLKAQWSGFASALTARDIERARNFFTSGARALYGPLLDALAAEIAQIVASFSPPLRSSLNSTIAEYAVVRVQGGLKRAYLVYFVRDSDGVWRIDSM